MTKLSILTYRDSNNQERQLDFIKNQELKSSHHTTILTGKNGSYKSTILGEIVRAVVDKQDTRAQFLFTNSDIQIKPSSKQVIHLIAISGAVADKYPAKSNGGRRTEFDVPNYVYLGQRVGANLISKKQSLETTVSFLLNNEVSERFGWTFYGRAFEFAGVIPRLDLTFSPRIRSKQKVRSGQKIISKTQSLLDRCTGLAHNTMHEKNRVYEISQTMAGYLLDEFAYDTFNELDIFLKSGNRKQVHLSLTEKPFSNGLSIEALRLGLLADEFTLVDAEVVSRKQRKPFSVFDLSSGEYHMFVTILGLGFSLRDDSIVLVDEPENSLHPQWQVEFMKTLFEMSAFMKDGHIIISTHSPLIVSSAKQGSTIVDLGKAGESIFEERSLFGASVDDILFDHFDVASSRNFYVLEKVQRAINLVEINDIYGDEFMILKVQLIEIKNLLTKEDPLITIIEALVEDGAR